jgi:hypothetical protein
MPNQANFRSNITTQTEPRFTASRIVSNPSELILFEEVPASFAFDAQDNVEVHFYTIPGNQLLLSATVTLNDEVVKSHIVAYNDNSYKNYIRIDFTKLFVDKNLILVPGDYRLVLNFFSDEIGSYTDRRLTIDTISPTRTEVQLTFNNVIDEVTRRENQYLLKEFVEPSFTKADAVGVAEKIFKSGVELDDSTEGVTADTIVENIEIPEINQTYANTMARIDRLNLRESFDAQVNNFLVELYSFIREEIVINGDDRIQQDEYEQFIRSVVENKIRFLYQAIDSRISAR